jgi:hypothetical protein
MNITLTAVMRTFHSVMIDPFGRKTFAAFNIHSNFKVFIFFSNIFHIYFVLLYNFMNYLQLRYLFLCTTEIGSEP